MNFDGGNTYGYSNTQMGAKIITDKGKLELAWEDVAASVNFTVK